MPFFVNLTINQSFQCLPAFPTIFNILCPRAFFTDVPFFPVGHNVLTSCSMCVQMEALRAAVARGLDASTVGACLETCFNLGVPPSSDLERAQVIIRAIKCCCARRVEEKQVAIFKSCCIKLFVKIEEAHSSSNLDYGYTYYCYDFWAFEVLSLSYPCGVATLLSLCFP